MKRKKNREIKITIFFLLPCEVNIWTMKVQENMILSFTCALILMFLGRGMGIENRAMKST